MGLVIIIIQMCGYAFILGFVLSLLNYQFGWHLGIHDAEVPADPAAAVVFLALGIVLTIVGRFLDKKFSAGSSEQ
ncbi:MAG TPA: hypothetical protein PKM58_04005 [Pyrinomonadaceae bacterium]|nr:hypothetical protein [Pyrinomonadaceae bacterium]HNU08603.1 hypothetical protein [Pyrinomonadaceae bacterium]